MTRRTARMIVIAAIAAVPVLLPLTYATAATAATAAGTQTYGPYPDEATCEYWLGGMPQPKSTRCYWEVGGWIFYTYY